MTDFWSAEDELKYANRVSKSAEEIANIRNYGDPGEVEVAAQRARLYLLEKHFRSWYIRNPTPKLQEIMTMCEESDTAVKRFVWLITLSPIQTCNYEEFKFWAITRLKGCKTFNAVLINEEGDKAWFDGDDVKHYHIHALCIPNRSVSPGNVSRQLSSGSGQEFFTASGQGVDVKRHRWIDIRNTIEYTTKEGRSLYSDKTWMREKVMHPSDAEI